MTQRLKGKVAVYSATRGVKGESLSNLLQREQLVELYRKMLTIRRFEEKVEELVWKGKIRNIAASSIGEEAVAVGTCSNLEKTDKILCPHRPHGQFIAKGASLKRMLAEIMGKKTGYCKGKGGSINMADFSIGALGANAIVGGQIPIATGVALASKLQKNDRVTICFFGDGASNEGTFHESLNLASVLHLPIVYLCVNNGYCMALPVEEAMAIRNIADRASSYGMPGEVVNGNDVLAVYEATRRAVIRAREGQGPTLLECKTYCWSVLHKEAVSFFTREDDYTERTAPKYGAPIPQEYKDKDPLPNYEKRLLQGGIISPEEVTRINKEVIKEIEEALSFAERSPDPLPEEAMEDLFSA